MNLTLVLIVFAPVDAADPCRDRGGTATASDPAGAALYRAVGDGERAAGHDSSAREAYREAVQHDPTDSAARAALSELCRTGDRDRDTVFVDAVELMKRGDRTAAIAAFESIRRAGADPAAALLEGICEYELGDDRRARALLEEARQDPRVADTALLFLGLITLHDGEGDAASAFLLAAVSGDVQIARTARDLARIARREGRLVASAMAESGYDSNVTLAPDGTTTPNGAADAHGAGLVALSYRPLGRAGPYGRATAQYRKQVQITSYDLGDVGGAVGLRAGRRGQYAAAEYAYDWLSLGGVSYLSAHGLLGTGRVMFGRWSATATYAARFESYLTMAAGAYSGLRQQAELVADRHLLSTASLGLGYHVGRDSTRDATLDYFEHGPVGFVRIGLGGGARLSADGRFTLRGYDGVDPDLLVRRSDRYLDGLVAAEVDVADHWTVRAAASVRRALSNVGDFQYAKLTATLGLVFTARVL